MRTICLYFEIHQIIHLKRYRFFDIGTDHYYYDDYANETSINDVAERSYIPALNTLIEMVKNSGGAFKVAFSISGVALEQLEIYAPAVIDLLHQLNDTGCCEFLAEPYSHGLSSLANEDCFKEEVMRQSAKMKQMFGKAPKVFRNSSLIYNDEIGAMVAALGFKGMLTEGAKHVLGWKSPHYVYHCSMNPNLKLLLRDFKLSDDISLRFSNSEWNEYPLFADKYINWIDALPQEEQVINVFMELSALGMAQPLSSNILEFLKALPYCAKEKGITFSTPTEIVTKLKSVSQLDVPYPMSWVDEERDTSCWLGNVMQREAFNKLYSVAERVHLCDDRRIKQDWDYLQASNNFRFMTTKQSGVGLNRGIYESPFDAFTNYMNILGDFIKRVDSLYPVDIDNEELNALLTVLSKSLKPLPIVKYKDGVAYDKFEDPELRYRQRYVDLIVNEGVKETFKKRAIVVKTLRAALDEAGYTEVETPILQSIPGGASARPFTTHHNSLDMDLYLRIATELYLKRLIVGGFEGVYEIGKNFRNEGMDKNHNPEFTCMELYVQYKDYNWMMSFTEKLLERICIAVNGSTDSIIDGKTISFKAPYRRLPILEAIKEKTGYDLNDKTEEEIRQVCKELKMEEIDETMGKGKLIDEIFGEFCEGTYIQPTFITDYPVEMSPLTKMHRSKPGLTERFELMVNGKELANAYSELNDPIDQEERFKEQMKLADKGDDEAMIIDQDFLRALQYGMPPTSGIGIGIDRLVMLMTGKPYIQEVLFFPQMRPEKITPKDSAAKFMELGIAEEWVPAIQKAGYNLVSDMKDVNPQKLHQDICGINKKYKLELTNPTVDEVAGWISKI